MTSMTERYQYLGFYWVEERESLSGQVWVRLYRDNEHVATAIREEVDPDGAPRWGLRQPDGSTRWFPSRLSLINYLKERV